MKNIETWKAIPGYEGWYEVSDMGRVRSLDRTIFIRRLGLRQTVTYRGRILALSIDRKGYSRIALCRYHKRKYKVHHLVLYAFVGPRPKGMECCHNNGICDDNRVENLRWDTREANRLDQLKHGGIHHGEEHWISKLTDAKVRSIRDMLARGQSTHSALAKKYGVSKRCIGLVKNRRTWGHVT